MEKKLIDLAYDAAKSKYLKKPFTFKQLWKELVKRAKLDAQEQEQAGHVYTAMLQDHRFIFVGNDQWKIREFLTLEQQTELSNALYDFASDNEPVKKTKEEDDLSPFEPDDDEDDTVKKPHEQPSIDDDEDEEEIDNESETAEDDESDDEDKDEKSNEEDE